MIDSHSVDSLESQNATATVVAIFRDNPSQAVAYLQEAALKATSPVQTQRLSKAADEAKSLAKKVNDLR